MESVLKHSLVNIGYSLVYPVLFFDSNSQLSPSSPVSRVSCGGGSLSAISARKTSYSALSRPYVGWRHWRVITSFRLRANTQCTSCRSILNHTAIYPLIHSSPYQQIEGLLAAVVIPKIGDINPTINPETARRVYYAPDHKHISGVGNCWMGCIGGFSNSILKGLTIQNMHSTIKKCYSSKFSIKNKRYGIFIFVKTVILLLLLTSYNLVKSQTSILSSGFDMVGSQGSASVSIGQVDYIYFDGQAGFVSEGVQQPIEWLSTYNGGPIIEDLHVDIYPNPTLNIVNLILENEMSFGIRIFSSTGQLVYVSVHQEERSVTVDFSAYPVGPYLLEIIEHTTQTPLSISRIIRL